MLSLQEFVPFCFKSYELVFKSQLPQTQIILQKDLLRQSSIKFLKGLFCSRWTFDIHIPVNSSVGLVIVSRFDIVSFTFFPYRSSKSFLWSRKGSCHSSRGLWGKRCVYVCRRKKGPGANQAGTNALQSFSTSKKEVSLTRSSLSLSFSLSLLCFSSSLSGPDVEFALSGG